MGATRRAGPPKNQRVSFRSGAMRTFREGGVAVQTAALAVPATPTARHLHAVDCGRERKGDRSGSGGRFVTGFRVSECPLYPQ